MSATEDFGSDEHQSALMKHITDGMNAYNYRANGRDVSKKMLHKVENGGSVGRARIGYLNDRVEYQGHLVNTIAVDPKRGPLVRWAFETYATGEYSLVALLELLGEQGLTTRPTAKWTEKTISRTQLANILRDPYYAGIIRYKGNLYRGRHEPLITKELFTRVQTVMNQRVQRGVRDVVHKHWGKGLLWCSRCAAKDAHTRLLYNEAKGHGGLYEYFFCRGRQSKTCDLPYLSTDEVEASVERLFGSIGSASLRMSSRRCGRRSSPQSSTHRTWSARCARACAPNSNVSRSKKSGSTTWPQRKSSEPTA